MDNKTYLDSQHAKNRSEWKSADADTSKTVASGPIKMLYMQHKLGTNYSAASDTEDNNMKRDILIGELAKLIVRHPEGVAAVLEKHGIKGTSKTRDGLVNGVSTGLNSNLDFTKNIALVISGNSGAASFGKEGQKQDRSEVLAGAKVIVKGLGELFGGSAKDKAQGAKDKAEAQKALSEATEAYSIGAGLGSSIRKKLIKAIVIAGVIGGAIWCFKSSN